MWNDRTPDYLYKGLIRFSWALARTKFSIFTQFLPGLDQALQIGLIFAWMVHQASEGGIFAWTMASGLKILIFPPCLLRFVWSPWSPQSFRHFWHGTLGAQCFTPDGICNFSGAMFHGQNVYYLQHVSLFRAGCTNVTSGSCAT